MPAPADRRRLEELFHAAADLDHAERKGFIADLASREPDLARRLEVLLDSDARTEVLRARVAVPTGQEIPTRIGPFDILDVLGEGGMGTVLRARQTTPIHRTVALKLLRPGLLNARGLARFEVERDALARMEHPNVARVLEAGTTDEGRPWFAMELCDGQPITRYADRLSLSIDARLALMIAVCRAVEHAHRKGVVHRDLKPSNILVADGDDGSIVKVIDFGIAKAIAADAPLDLTRDGDGLLGTPEYMSPEQVLGGATAADTRSDVWALGVITHELCAGTRPFAATGTAPADDYDLLRRIAERPVAALSATPRVASWPRRRDLDAVIFRALAKDPEQRYPTPDAFADDLDRLLNDAPVVARLPSLGERLARTFRQHRATVLFSTVGLLGLVVALAITISLYRLATDRLADFRRMADAQLVRELEADANEALWPPWPERLPEYADWLDREAALHARLPAHRAVIAGVESAASDLDENEREWVRTTLDELISRAERLREGEASLVASVRSRIAMAERLRDIEQAHSDEWDRALATLADPVPCPRYAGLRITRQPGLVPLGRNARTGLMEFWHALSGDRPRWRADARWTVRPEDGIVLVLVPGGTVPMGCARQPPGEPAVAMADPRAGNVEEPVHPVELAPYLIAAHEITQAQWIRLAGSNPSRFAPGARVGHGAITLTNPVDQVSWTECMQVLGRYGLTLPTEAQWERACRADTRTAFWCGHEVSELMAVGANIADEAAAKMAFPGQPFDPGLDDGHVAHAPVGSFAPNPFGLYDVHGNVEEWCRDRFCDYRLPTAPGDGLRVDPDSNGKMRVMRGGSFYRPAATARSSARDQSDEAYRVAYRGARAAAALR